MERKNNTVQNKYIRLLIFGLEGISYLFDAFVVLTLFGVGIFLMVWIIYEFYMVLIGQLPIERGGLSILGSILVLYAISELLLGELRRLKGGTISIKVFLSVALAAVIRKVLILSLTPEKHEELIVLALLVLALGIVFWLINRAETTI
ncbi:MAG: hypothetical protein D6674_07975 [Acidobacteria bacterium]|jgi:uncharacterized membrane protein (DUF373 family)|nr:MAG: hypothetical protein D6674_07975 [Acidobacteriota bacterium]